MERMFSWPPRVPVPLFLVHQTPGLTHNSQNVSLSHPAELSVRAAKSRPRMAVGRQRPRLVGRGPWGLIGGRYFPVTCPCKSLNFTSTSTAPPHTFGSSSQSHHHNGQHPLCPFHAATKRLQGEATVVQFIRIPVWSCQRQSQVRPVLHRQIQPAFTTCPASDSQSSPEHFQSCRHHTTCFPCLPYPPPSDCPPLPPVPESRFCRLLDP